MDKIEIFTFEDTADHVVLVLSIYGVDAVDKDINILRDLIYREFESWPPLYLIQKVLIDPPIF